MKFTSHRHPSAETSAHARTGASYKSHPPAQSLDPQKKSLCRQILQTFGALLRMKFKHFREQWPDVFPAGKSIKVNEAPTPGEETAELDKEPPFGACALRCVLQKTPFPRQLDKEANATRTFSHFFTSALQNNE